MVEVNSRLVTVNPMAVRKRDYNTVILYCKLFLFRNEKRELLFNVDSPTRSKTILKVVLVWQLGIAQTYAHRLELQQCTANPVR